MIIGAVSGRWVSRTRTQVCGYTLYLYMPAFLLGIQCLSVCLSARLSLADGCSAVYAWTGPLDHSVVL